MSHCYIPRVSSAKQGQPLHGWFLVTWPWLKSNVSRSCTWRKVPRSGYITRHVIKARWKMASKKAGKTLPVFFLVIRGVHAHSCIMGNQGKIVGKVCKNSRHFVDVFNKKNYSTHNCWIWDDSANSELRASLAIYHLISNEHSWNNC